MRLRIQRKVGQLDYTNFAAPSDLLTSGVHAGNSQLRPDQHMQYKLHLQRQFWRSGTLRLGLLHDEMADAIDCVPIYAKGTMYDASGHLSNERDNKIYVDARLLLTRLDIARGKLRLKSAFRFSSVQDPVIHQARRISGKHPHSIRVNFAQDISRSQSTWGIGFDESWDEYYYRVQSYELWFIVLPYIQIHRQYDPVSAWSLRAEVDNALPIIFGETVITYNGLRDASTLLQITRLQINSQPRLFLQIRHAFGQMRFRQIRE